MVWYVNATVQCTDISKNPTLWSVILPSPSRRSNVGPNQTLFFGLILELLEYMKMPMLILCMVGCVVLLILKQM